MTIIITALLFILFIQHLGLRDRVKRLEEKLFIHHGDTKVGSLPFSVPREHEPLPSPFEKPTPLPPPVWGNLPPPVRTGSSALPSPEWFFVRWFKEHTLIKIGGIFFFLGAAWFVSYAIKSGWLSPELRILLGVMMAVAAYSLAWYRARTSQGELCLLTALGTAIMLVTVLVAHVSFSLIPLWLTLGLVLGTVAYTVSVAITTRSLWLAHISAVAGFSVPLFVTGLTDSFTLLFYLLTLCLGLLLIGLRLQWRTLTLLLLCGVIFYELTLLAGTERSLLWLFVIIFSLTFLLTVTVSLVRSAKPVIIDIVTLLIIAASYVFFVSHLAYNEGLAVFVATTLIGFIGYLFMHYRFPSTVVAVYLLLAGAGVLIGTSFLLSGYTLTLVFVVEIAAAFLLVTYLGLPERMVWIVAALFILPLWGSGVALTSAAWTQGVWHTDALVAYAMFLALLISTLWIVHKPGVAIYPSSNWLAAVLGCTTFGFAYAVSAVVTNALFTPADAPVFTYVWWALISLSVLYYLYKQQLPLGVHFTVFGSLLLPTYLSCASFFSPAWEDGIYHLHSFGVFSMIGILCLSLLLLTQQYYRDSDLRARAVIGFGMAVTVVYVAGVLARVWYSLLTPDSALVATYVSYAFILYVLVSAYVLARAPLSWVRVGLMGFFVPLVLSLNSFTFSGWAAGPLSFDAVGLFALIIIFILLALGMRRHGTWQAETVTGSFVIQASRALLVVAASYSAGLIWCLTHSVVAKTEAISLALFVYTVVGLIAYLYGKRTAEREYSYLGIAFLTIVVGRLLLIDIWNMESVWRFITLLVIGSLFIAAAFLERAPKKTL